MTQSNRSEEFGNALENLDEDVHHLEDDFGSEFTVWRDDDSSANMYAEVGDDSVTAVAYDQDSPGMADADLFDKGGKAEHVFALAELYTTVRDSDQEELILPGDSTAGGLHDWREAYEVMGGVTADTDAYDDGDVETVEAETREMLESVNARVVDITGSPEDAAEYVASMTYSEEGLETEGVNL